MNLCACLGKVVSINDEGKHLKFTLSVWQEKTCYIVCVVFNASSEDKEKVRELADSSRLIWVQGWLVNFEIRLLGTKFITTELATTSFNIKEV
jgi:hypothetical protein